MERLRKEGAALVYRCAKQRSEPTSDKRGAKADELTLTPLELIDRIAALVPPPRTHRHRYFGVLAPNSPLRAAAVALATPQQPIKQVVVQTEPAATGEGVPAVAPLGHAIPPTPEPAPPKRAPAHYLWAVLIARIYEVFPLLCPICGGQMRLIAFITEGTQIRRILDHIGVDSEPPQISPARGPPLWDDCDAHVGEGIEVEPDWDLAAQPAPRLRSGPARQLVTEQDGGINRCGESLRARQPKMRIASQALAIERQASAQSALVCLGRRVSKPKTRAILGLMRLNFLSVHRILETRRNSRHQHCHPVILPGATKTLKFGSSRS
jgi:hypothetical protein